MKKNKSNSIKNIQQRRDTWAKYAWIMIVSPIAFFFVLKVVGLAHEPFRVGGKSQEVQYDYIVRTSGKPENKNIYVFKGGSTEKNCDRHYPLGAPDIKMSQNPEDNAVKNGKSALLCYDEFALHWNAQSKHPIWGSYTLTVSDWQSGTARHTAKKWLPDENIQKLSPKSVVTPKVVQQSGMVALPLLPQSDFAYSERATEQSSQTTNLVAVHPHASQAWQTLNKAILGLLGKKNPTENDVLERLFVVSGVIYKPLRGEFAPKRGQPRFFTFGNDIQTPTYLYKAVLHPRTGRSIAFLVPNHKTDKAINLKDEEVAITIAELERQTGVSFFNNAEVRKKVPMKQNKELLKWF